MNLRLTVIIAAAALTATSALFFVLQPDPEPTGTTEFSPEVQIDEPSTRPALLRASAETILSATAKAKQDGIDAELQRQHDAFAEEGERKRKEEELAQQPIPAPLPTALLEPDQQLLANPEQRQAIESVRQQFLKAMSAAGDPSSREYGEQWMAEQERADELLSAYLGQEDFSKFRQEGRYGE